MTLTKTEQLLATYADLINLHGASSMRAREFFESNSDIEEFVELAEIMLQLKDALVSPSAGCNAADNR